MTNIHEPDASDAINPECAVFKLPAWAAVAGSIIILILKYWTTR